MTKTLMKKHVENLQKKIAKITGAKTVDGRINEDDEQVILEFRAEIEPSDGIEDKITEAVNAEIPEGVAQTQMPNMSYCRMENTASALGDCVNHWDEKLTNEYEIRGKKNIVSLAREIVRMEAENEEKEN